MMDIGGIRCLPAPRHDGEATGPQLWWFLPTGVVAQRPGGRSSVLLVPAGAGGLLQLGAQLGPDAATIEATRTELARTVGTGPAGLVLGPAPVACAQAELRLVGDLGEVTLARATTSGNFPHTVLFSVALDPGQAAAVAAALAGRPGVLEVRYTGLAWEAWAAPSRTTSTSTSSTSSSSTSSGSSTSSAPGRTTVAHSHTSRRDATSVDPPDLPALPALPARLAADVATWPTARHLEM